MFTDCLYISSINPILSNSYPNYTIKITVLYIFIHIQHRYLFRYTKQLRTYSTYVVRTPPNFVESLLSAYNGPGGSRTRVQTRIPRSSTIIVSSLTFIRKPIPPNSGNKHQQKNSSFNYH